MNLGILTLATTKIFIWAPKTMTRKKIMAVIWPRARSHLHSAGPCPSHASFTARSSYPHLRGNSSSLEKQCDNTRSKLQIFKLTSLFSFPRLIDGVPSHAKWTWWLKWPGIVTLVPNQEEFVRRCMLKGWAMKEAWEGRGPSEWRCDLARGRDLVLLISSHESQLTLSML